MSKSRAHVWAAEDVGGIVFARELLVEPLTGSGYKGAHAAGKVATIVAGMLAGANSIDDLDIAWLGGMRSLFAGVYAPSTAGSFLRAFTHGHVGQVRAAARDTLIGLTGQAPILTGAEVRCFLDID